MVTFKEGDLIATKGLKGNNTNGYFIDKKSILKVIKPNKPGSNRIAVELIEGAVWYAYGPLKPIGFHFIVTTNCFRLVSRAYVDNYSIW